MEASPRIRVVFLLTFFPNFFAPVPSAKGPLGASEDRFEHQAMERYRKPALAGPKLPRGEIAPAVKCNLSEDENGLLLMEEEWPAGYNRL